MWIRALFPYIACLTVNDRIIWNRGGSLPHLVKSLDLYRHLLGVDKNASISFVLSLCTSCLTFPDSVVI